MAGTGPVDVENITQALQGLVLKSLCVCVCACRVLYLRLVSFKVFVYER